MHALISGLVGANSSGVLCNWIHGMLFICIKLLLMLQSSEAFASEPFHEKNPNYFLSYWDYS